MTINLIDACDLHIHPGPDIFPRLTTDVETAEICREAGMRAILFKSHADTTMLRAYHTEQRVPGIKVLGGITLNHQSGGINPAAVDVALKLGAVQVWMPTYHSLAHYQATGKLGGYSFQGSNDETKYKIEPIYILDDKEELLKEVVEVLELVKEANVIIGTSHLSSKEALKLIEIAREIGCERVVLTHPFYPTPGCTIDMVKKAVDMGAFIEFCAGNALSQIPHIVPLKDYKEIIDLCDTEKLIISSDSGQPRKTTPPETIRMFAQSLMYYGVQERDLEAMMKKNYEKIIDFD